MALLYQEIMNVPGLSGTWQQRNKDLYYKLGAPMGSYTGSLAQNSWLLNKVTSNNYYKNSQPWNPQPAPVSTPVANPMQQIADSTLGNVNPTPNFQTVMPQDTWNGVFDEWTRNFANEYVLPEWQANTYNPAVEEMTRGLGNLNQQVGMSGSWRSGTANDSIQRAAEDSLKQEAQLRTDYQSDIAKLRDQIQTSWANPLYTSQMNRYINSPWADMNLGTMSNDAGINAQTMIANLGSQYGVTDTSKLGSLISNLGNWDPANAPDTTTYDWSVPRGNLSLIEQYK